MRHPVAVHSPWDLVVPDVLFLDLKNCNCSYIRVKVIYLTVVLIFTFPKDQ